jgi:leucyl aminopeptidase
VLLATRQEVEAGSLPLQAEVCRDILNHEDGKTSIRTYDADGSVSLVTCLGDESKVTADDVACAVKSSLDNLRKGGISDAHVSVSTSVSGSVGADYVAQALAQAVMLGQYTWDCHLSEHSRSKPPISVHTDTNIAAGELALLEAMANGTTLARDLVNERGDVVNPASLHEVALEVAEAGNCEVHVVEGVDALRSEGCNMLASVGQASAWAPRMVMVHYNGTGGGTPESADGDAVTGRTMLVGKGLTFDTGGLNLKPTGFIEDMHGDMGGAAAVLGALHAVIQLKLPVDLVVALAIAENAIGSEAYKPHAILKSHKGLSVLNGNTDAEGRLALGDTLSYAQGRYRPDTIIDVATLTGACVVALGEYYSGVFGSDSHLVSQLVDAGTRRGDLAWAMPIGAGHRKELKSTVADTSSTGTGRYGGACTAAAFLEKFVDTSSTKWAHVDIAGPAYTSKAYGILPAGATGHGVHMLTQHLVDASQGQ